MGKKHKHIYDLITAPERLHDAFERASRGKRSSLAYLRFAEHAETNIAAIRRSLLDGTWAPSPSRVFTVTEPKPRLVQAPPFRDRIVHHALVDVIEPIFDAGFAPTVFACRRGRGTHAAMGWVRGQLRGGVWTHTLHTDFSAFFASIDRRILHAILNRKITDRRTRWLIRQIVPDQGTGLPIGALTSQLFANVYAGELDHYLTHVLRVRWCRYMDDVIVLGSSQKNLLEVQAEIEAFARDRLTLRLSRWRLAPISAGVDFVGYRIWPHRVLLRKRSVTKARRRLASSAARADWEDLAQFWPSWRGHAQHANTRVLLADLDHRHHLTVGIARHRQTQPALAGRAELAGIFGTTPTAPDCLKGPRQPRCSTSAHNGGGVTPPALP